MAPAMKRRASTSASAPKRGKKAGGPVVEKLAMVSAAIQDAELPKVVKSMLVEVTTESLGIVKEERHDCQKEVVEMIGTTLASIQASMQKTINEGNARFAAADREKAQRDSTLASAEQQVSTANQQVNGIFSRSSAVEESKVALKAAQDAFEKAEAAQFQCEKSAKEAVGKKQSLEGVLHDALMPLTEGTLSDAKMAKKQLGSLLSVLKTFAFEADQLKVLPGVLKKAPSSRTSFETALLADVGEDIKSRVATLDVIIQGADAAKAEHSAATQAMQAALDAATAKHDDNQTQLKSAKLVLKEATKVLESAKAAVASFGGDMRQLQKETAQVMDTLDTFCKGPMASFKDLKDRVAPPPEPEETPTAEATIEPPIEP